MPEQLSKEQQDSIVESVRFENQPEKVRLRDAAAAVEKAKPAQSKIGAAREKAATRHVRDLLEGMVSGIAVGTALHAEDRKALLDELSAETEGMPQRVRDELRKVGERAVELIESGDKGKAREFIRAEGLAVGSNLGAAPTWTPPSETESIDEAREIAARIPRGA